MDDFQVLGLDVVVWDVYAAQDHRPSWVREARESTAARWLRQSARGSALYHALGFAVMLIRRAWPRARALQRVIEQREIDLVHTNIRVGHDREAVVAAQMAGIPCVCHIRDFEQLNWYDRKLARLVDSFIYISEAVQTRHLEAGVPRAKGRVVYNAVDVAAFDTALDVAQGRQSLACRLTIVRKNGAGQTVRGCGVNEPQRLIPVVARIDKHRDNGPEDLVTHGHIVGLLGLNDRRPDEVTLGLVRLTSYEDAGVA